MTNRRTTNQPTKRPDTLARRILTLISIVVFLGLPIYGVHDGSD